MLREHKGIYVAGLLIWFSAILFLQIVPSQSDFHLLSIGFPLAFVSYLFFIWFKPQGTKLRWLIGVGVFARIVSIFFFPELSDDIYRFICQNYSFVRLLKDSNQTPEVQESILKLDVFFDECLSDISNYIDFDEFEVLDVNVLAKVQLGSGLIALNSCLDK